MHIDSIQVSDDNVTRPLSRWSSTVHEFLSYLKQNGFDAAPVCLDTFVDEFGQGREVMSKVAGDTYDYPLRGAIASNEALISCAKLQRHFHQVSAQYVDWCKQQQIDLLKREWMLAPRPPFEVICHGDFTPYNVALTDNQVTGIFDFDTAHPAPLIWDVAFSVYCFAPFKTVHPDALGTLTAQISRARLYCDSYQLSDALRMQLVDTMIERVGALVEFMQSSEGGAYGNEQQLNAYLADIEYMTAHKQQITHALLE